MECEQPPASLAGGSLGPQPHVCAFFNSRDDEYRTLLPFVKEGLDRREKAIHIVDPVLRDEHLGSSKCSTGTRRTCEADASIAAGRSEEHTSELQSPVH